MMNKKETAGDWPTVEECTRNRTAENIRENHGILAQS